MRVLLRTLSLGLLTFSLLAGCVQLSTSTPTLDATDAPTLIPPPSISDFSIYPNPASSELTIVYHLENVTSAVVILHDITSVEAIRHSLPVKETSFSFPVKELKPGVYFCQVIANDKRVFLEKLVLIR